MGAIKAVGSDGEPYLGFWHRNKARFIAFLVLGSIITLITFVVLGFLDSDSCKKNKTQIAAMGSTAVALSILYITVIHKHVSIRFGKMIKYPSFTGYDIVSKITETNKINRLKDTIAQYDMTRSDFV